MASCCNVHGVVGVRNGRAFTYSQGKTFWKHDGFLPLPSGDLAVDFFTFGGDPAPLEDGPYSGIARVVSQTTAGSNVDTSDPILQLFATDDFVAMPLMAAECDSQMPSPAFVTVGRVCRSNLDVNQNRAFDIDVSQYGAAPQQLIRLRCFYPSSHTRFHKTPLPNVGKHVVVHGYLTGFHHGRCLIHVRDIALGPGDITSPTTEMPPSMTLGRFNWKGRGTKRAKYENDSDGDHTSASQPTPSSSQSACA
ncbi:hypothetical protein EDD15DRAFT_2197349 [Pisolithus albus]|nr:hypothetical protein EDD15DRAFT_2197349 [Pisolithus albus]